MLNSDNLQVKTYKEKAVTGVYWMGFMTVSNFIITILTTMILSRLLTPRQFGIVASVQIVISFAEIFWMMGVVPAITQKKTLLPEDIYTGNTLNIIFGIMVCLFISLFAKAIAVFVGIENILILQILSIVFVIHSFSGVSEALLTKEMKFKAIGLVKLVTLIIYSSTAIIFALSNYGAWALVIGRLVEAFAKTVIVIGLKPVKLSFKINLKSTKSLLNIGTGFTIARVLNNLAIQGDYFVVNKTLGSYALSFYSRAYQILMMPTNIVGQVIDKVMFPLMARFQDDKDKIRYVFFNITLLISVIAIPLTIFMFVLGSDLVLLILGKNWGKAVTPFRILILALFFRIAYKVCDSIVRSLGAVYKRVWVQVVYCVMVFGGAYFGKKWGINGVAVTTSIAIFINYIIMTLLIKHLINFRITKLLVYLIPFTIFSAFIGFLCYFFNNWIIIDLFLPIRFLAVFGFLLLMYFLLVLSIKKCVPDGFLVFVFTILKITLKDNSRLLILFQRFFNYNDSKIDKNKPSLKIGILTFHYSINQGSVIQAYCIYKLLCEKITNAKIEVINLIPYNREIQELKFINLRSPFIHLSNFRRYKSIRKFVNSNIRLSKTSYSRNLEKQIRFINQLNYDYIFTGSDTVWMYSHKLDYKLPSIYFLPNEIRAKKISIAASVDPLINHIIYKEKSKIICDTLNCYKSITVRDDTSKKVLEVAGVKGVQKIADPSFLFDFEKQLNIRVEKNGDIKKSNIYIMITDKKIEEEIKHIVSKYFKLTIIEAKYPINIDYVTGDLNRYCEYDIVITDRFHRSVFAMKLSKALVINIERYSKNPSPYSKGRDLFTDIGIPEYCLRYDYNNNVFKEKLLYLIDNWDKEMFLKREKLLQKYISKNKLLWENIIISAMDTKSDVK